MNSTFGTFQTFLSDPQSFFLTEDTGALVFLLVVGAFLGQLSFFALTKLLRRLAPRAHDTTTTPTTATATSPVTLATTSTTAGTTAMPLSPTAAPSSGFLSVETEYDVVIDIQRLRTIDFPVYARDRETLAAFESSFMGKTVVAWGPYNVGKTFLLGRIFGVRFRSESLTDRTKALSYKRFEFGSSQSRYFMVIDCAGNSTPSNAEDDKSLLDKFATEKFLHEFAYLSSDYILLVFDCGSWDNTQKILYHRRRAFKNKEQKEIFIVFNWKMAKTMATIEQLVNEEVLSTYQSGGGALQLDETGNPDFFYLARNPQKELASAKIFWFGDDREPETRAYNTKTATRIFDMIKNIEVFKEIQPLQLLYSELGAAFTPPFPPTPSLRPATALNSASTGNDNRDDDNHHDAHSEAEVGGPEERPATYNFPIPSHDQRQSTPQLLGTKKLNRQAPLLFACYEGTMPCVEVREVEEAGGTLASAPEGRSQRLTLMRKIVSQGDQKMKGELRFERDHLRFTEFDIDPEIFVSCTSDNNQPLVKVYAFSFPGLKPVTRQRTEPSANRPLSTGDAHPPNTFALKVLKKGYAFEVQATRGIPFDGLGMTSQSCLNFVSNNTSSGYFELGEYVVKFSDFLRGILLVWVLKVDEQGAILEEAQQQLECLRISHLTANDLVLETIPEGPLNEFK